MRERRLLLLTGAYFLALAVVGLWSTPVDRDLAVTGWRPVVWTGDLLGLDPWQMYDVVEMSANVVLFVPLGALVLLWRPNWGLAHGIAAAFVTTVVIETLQQVTRPERFASVTDVVANTLGGAIGAWLVIGSRRWLRR
jgi:VanZ family protein